MNGSGPPGNGKGGRQAAYPETANASDVGQSVTEFSGLRKPSRIVAVRRCLPKDDWQWLRWEAETRELYYGY
jgi:hypothetical protein